MGEGEVILRKSTPEVIYPRPNTAYGLAMKLVCGLP